MVKKKVPSAAKKTAAPKKPSASWMLRGGSIPEDEESPIVTPKKSKLIDPAETIIKPRKEGIASPSEEQMDIFIAGRDREEHLVIKATAGSGKTTTCVHMIDEYIPKSKRVVMLVFNVHNARDMDLKAKKRGVRNALFSTFNSFGNMVYKEWNPNVVFDEDKLDRIIASLVPEDEVKFVIGPLSRVVRLMKAHNMEGTYDDLERLLDIYDLDLSDYSKRQIRQYATPVMQRCLADSGTIDFDDQLWLTVRLKVPIREFDIAIADESQDLTATQHQLLIGAAGSRGRIVMVGDPRQAIYGWRGADPKSMETIVGHLKDSSRGILTLPLSISWRCPRSHIRLAQIVEPTIRWAPDAPEGEEHEITSEQFYEKVRPGDLVMSRVNAPLLGACYALLKRGVPATVRGKQIGKGLASVVRRLKAFSIPDLLTKIEDYDSKEGAKILALGRKGETRYITHRDKVDCLVQLALNNDSVDGLLRQIDGLFSEFDDEGKPLDKVVLGTYYRTKGLEAWNTFVLCPELMPHPMAKSPEEKAQEMNGIFIVLTRAKYDRENLTERPGKLHWVGKRPAILNAPEKMAEVLD